MKAFHCDNCGASVYFENVLCLNCKHELAYAPELQCMVALERRSDGLLARVKEPEGRGLRYCSNSQYGVCNWLTPADDPDTACEACDLNRTIPNLQEPNGLAFWAELELAKKRLVYGLQRFGLPLRSTARGTGLMFDFVRNAVTGHLDGVVTIDIMEADGVQRERQRQHFGEPYRSLLGHLRHESGHYYWHQLVEEAGATQSFRQTYGDEREDYGGALARHHADGPPAGWEAQHVSAYASAHPWEDWAETWAHYLHMVDTLETAEAQGMEPRAAGLSFGALWPFQSYDIYRDETFDALVERWVPLVLALNSLNRSMGHGDFYPFVVPAQAYGKMRFVHDRIRAGAG